MKFSVALPVLRPLKSVTWFKWSLALLFSVPVTALVLYFKTHGHLAAIKRRNWYFNNIVTRKRLLHLFSAGAIFGLTWNWVPHTKLFYPFCEKSHWKVFSSVLETWVSSPSNFGFLASVKQLTCFIPPHITLLLHIMANQELVFLWSLSLNAPCKVIEVALCKVKSPADLIQT